tara:strand:+ start:187 stop:420 length:234 start_codon:yes stop_codon:yes gene_type:complete
MEKYIDNYGNEIEADYARQLPFGNKRDDVLSEEIWRRLWYINSTLDSSDARDLLQSVLSDLEYWMEINPIESPARWE